MILKSEKLINRETLLYGIFGVATTVLNIVLFKVLLLLSVEYKTANLITLVVVKLAAYVCNKKYVFCTKSENFGELLKEFGRFVIARGATAIIDYIGLILLVELLKMGKTPGKVIMTVVVVIVNYFLGKKHVFKKKER